MKLAVLIERLEEIQKSKGNIDVQVQGDQVQGDSASSMGIIVADERFFVVPEEYYDGWRVNIRTWPY